MFMRSRIPPLWPGLFALTTLLLASIGISCGDEGESAPDVGASADVGDVGAQVADSGEAGDVSEPGEAPELCPLQQEGDPGLTVGRCEVADSGQDCTGASDEVEVFVPLSDGDEVAIVQGFQGATMLNFSVRTSGINPGDPDDIDSRLNPIVEVRVYRTSYSVVGRFRGRVAFVPHSADPTLLIGSDLFVLLESTVPVEVGQTLTAVITIRDSDGEERCGFVAFVVES